MGHVCIGARTNIATPVERVILIATGFPGKGRQFPEEV